MVSFHSYQHDLLKQIEQATGKAIDATIRQAFLDTPRHLFVQQYLNPMSQQWCNINIDGGEEHFPILYSDRSLVIYKPCDSHFVSTISQPSLVLDMLAMMDIQPGNTIFEIGAGSGWNAAMMSQLVGVEGHVYSMEIFPELVNSTRRTIERIGFQAVTVLLGDGAMGYMHGAPFDRIIFTAGSYDIPFELHRQLKENGLLLAVLKLAGGGDDVVLFRKLNGVLVSQHSSPAMFIPMLGGSLSKSLDGVELSSFLVDHNLVVKPIGQKPFWWGRRLSRNMMQDTEGIRSFLQFSEPGYRVFLTGESIVDVCFGMYDEENCSLVVVQNNLLTSYGSFDAENKFLEILSQWIKMGMPSSVQLSLRVYPKPDYLPDNHEGWILDRPNSIFLSRLI
ncbi:protein-L-isoaspartate O-methyltransferase [Dyadobacter sp. LHD-138]|uniref:protein-L-isoaspartate O-methyltransferase family protein n=1 Tax=Dyadobacter sp. LHD-138 TaxID=3071413 RepID=UPI0027DEDEA0|nr:protein-L-isoaspartate O-methyltransferase [Dyadobacter sp. LHD-138]MDQ6481784.1 protein-L-isoaspartate O-methyltransferase [Dyadobacter sp. LHD-138]